MEKECSVVVVDDQYVSRSFFEIHVGMSKGYALAASLSGAEQAIAFCLAHPVDLVIMDVMMKYGLDGLTCAKTIHCNNPGVRIILTTSTAEAQWIHEAWEAGIDPNSRIAEDAEIYYILEGEAEVTDNDKTAVMRAGNVMFTGNGARHSIANHSGKDVKFLACILRM